MDHTRRRTNADRLTRIEGRIEMLSFFTSADFDSAPVPSPAVWAALAEELAELATEIREIRQGLSAEAQDAIPGLGGRPDDALPSEGRAAASRPGRTLRQAAEPRMPAGSESRSH